MAKNGITWIDISVALRRELPVWPGDPPFCLSRLAEVAGGDEATVSGLSLGVHCGTHLDARAILSPAPAIWIPFLLRRNGPVKVVEILGTSATVR
jgi:arylformamidase